MENAADPVRVKKADVLGLIGACLKHPRDGHGDFGVVAGGGFRMEPRDIASPGVYVCDANAAHRSSRLANSILDANGYTGARRMVDWPAEDVLKAEGARVVAVNDAGELWAGLRGKALRIAQAQLVYYSNTSGAKFILLGGRDMLEGVRSHTQLRWRYEVVRAPEDVRYFA